MITLTRDNYEALNDQETLALAIYNDELDFHETVNAIMREGLEVHGIDLQGCVNDALGDDNVSAYAVRAVMSGSAISKVCLYRAIKEATRHYVELATKNIITDYHPDWELKR